MFGDETRPNKCYFEYAKGADLAILECFPTPEEIAAFNGWKLHEVTFVSSQIHTPSQGFGKVMSVVKPRMMVAFHTVLFPEKQIGGCSRN